MSGATGGAGTPASDDRRIIKTPDDNGPVKVDCGFVTVVTYVKLRDLRRLQQPHRGLEKKSLSDLAVSVGDGTPMNPRASRVWGEVRRRRPAVRTI